MADQPSFNADISSWDMSSVRVANEMFQGATRFNQNLCAWRDDFPYGASDDIFVNSGCTIEDPPRRLFLGPFCASECDPVEDENTGGTLVIDEGPVLPGTGPVLPGDTYPAEPQPPVPSSSSRIKLDSFLLAATAVTFALACSV